MKFLYNIFTYLLNISCILMKHLGNKKIALMVDGQKQAFIDIESLSKNCKTAWFHCASLGEFEQARNLIEKLKDDYPDMQILLTFFSPSGYEVRKNYSKADCVTYLPIDTPKNATLFIKKVNPSLVFFVKYEFWWNYIRKLKDVPLYSISLILRKNHYLFKPICGYFRKQLACFNYFFVQDENTSTLLSRHGYTNNIVAGDTRFDRVISMSQESKSFPLIEKFKDGKPLFIAGSSWPEDEKIIHKALNGFDNLKIIIAPHLIDTHHINNIKQLFRNSVTLSELTEENCTQYNVLIIDNIGMLMYLYSLCDLAYVGGGFGVGIHNILEAAVFYKPVCFGPNNAKFKEAVDLLAMNAAKQITNAQELLEWVNVMTTHDNIYNNTASLCGDYVRNHAGATSVIINKVMKQ